MNRLILPLSLLLLLLGLAVIWCRPGRLPGVETRDPDALDPAFRARLERVLDRVEARGFRPRIRATWRSEERQRYYRALGWSRVSWGLHCHRDAAGRPAALAADVDARGARSDVERAAFYLALRDEAPSQGLETGGTWSRTNPRWARHGLGWDPGHVQPAACTAAAARRGRCPRW